jgi:hypothetical protein
MTRTGLQTTNRTGKRWRSERHGCFDYYKFLSGILVVQSNFLGEFTELNPRKTKKTKKQQFVEVCWLDLLLNLSFSVEGQQTFHF